MDRAREPAAIPWTLAFNAALALLFLPFAGLQLARTLVPDSLAESRDAALFASIALLLGGQLLLLLLPGVAAAAGASRLAGPRAARWAARLWGAAVVGGLGTDLSARRLTGNSLFYYLGFLPEPEALHWAGSPAELGKLLAPPALQLGAAAIVAVALAGLFAGWAARGHGGSGRRRLAALVALHAAAIPGAPLLRAAVGTPPAFEVIAEELPLAWPIGPGESVSSLERRGSRIYRRHFDAFRAPMAVEVPPLPIAPRPDVTLVVLESFRADLISPEITPNLWALGARGTRFVYHHANSNTSHVGLFSLMTGRFPSSQRAYFDSDEPPALGSWFLRAGYRMHLFIGSRFEWKRMPQLFPRNEWEVHESLEGENWQRDAVSVDAVRRHLAGGEGPLLTVVYLMSTHLSYSYPESYEDFQVPLHSFPGLKLELALRYRRAARYLDDLLAELLDAMDLDRRIVLVTGDHGETFGEDGHLGHGSRASEAQTRVPLLIAGPGVPRGAVLDVPTEHVDIAPTLLHLAGFPASALAGLPGRAWFADSGTQPASYSVIVYGKPYDHVNLLSPDLRFAFKLSRKEPRIGFRGTLTPMGRISPEPATPEEQETFLVWLEDFLRRSTRGRDGTVPR